MISRLPLETWGRRWLDGLQVRADRTPLSRFAFAFLMFGIKQAPACLFGGAMPGLILLTFLVWPEDSPVSRCYFLVIGAVLIQAAVLILKLESWAEARVILLFQIAGTMMALFRAMATHSGQRAAVGIKS